MEKSAKSSFICGATDRITDVISKGRHELEESADDFIRMGKETQASCKSLPFTILFYASFVLAQWLHRDVDTTYPLVSSLDYAMNSGVVPAPLSVNAPEKLGDIRTSSRFTKLSDVKSWGDALMYMELTVAPFIWADGDGGPGAVMSVNQLIGGVRLQQWRLSTAECGGAQELGDAYLSFMHSKYNRTCWSQGSDYDSADIAGSRPTDSAVLQGDKADSDTGAYTYWIPAGQTMVQARSHIQRLRENRWLSAATSNLKVQYALYCGQVGYFASVNVDISMDPVGAFTATMRSSSLPTTVWGKWGSIFADLWFCFNIFYLSCGEVVGLARAAKKKELTKHICQFYRMVNLSLIVVGAGVIIFFMWMFQQLDDVTEKLTSVLQVDAAKLTGEAATRHITKLDDTYDLITSIGQRARWNELVAFWYSMMMLIKFFQTFQANERLAIITKTLRVASEDLLHFMLIFMLVFSNFVLGAYFLFGKSLKEWSSPILAFNTGFRALMGDFDFNAMYLIAPATATVWFVIYMCLIFLLMINMLLAMVMDAYATVKAETRESENLLQLMKRRLTTTKNTGKSFARSASKTFTPPRSRRSWSSPFHAKQKDDAEDTESEPESDAEQEGNVVEEFHMEVDELKSLPQSGQGSKRNSRQSGRGSRRQSGRGSRSSRPGSTEDQLEAIASKLAALEVAVRSRAPSMADGDACGPSPSDVVVEVESLGQLGAVPPPLAAEPQGWLPPVRRLTSAAEAAAEAIRGARSPASPDDNSPVGPGAQGDDSPSLASLRRFRSDGARTVGRMRLRVRDVV